MIFARDDAIAGLLALGHVSRKRYTWKQLLPSSSDWLPSSSTANLELISSLGLAAVSLLVPYAKLR